MKNLQNNKTIGGVAILSFIVGVCTLVLAITTKATAETMAQKNTMYEIGGLSLALSLVLGILTLQKRIRQNKKKDRYHAVHWNNGHISKDA